MSFNEIVEVLDDQACFVHTAAKLFRLLGSDGLRDYRQETAAFVMVEFLQATIDLEPDDRRME